MNWFGVKGQHGPKELDNVFPEPVWKAFGVQVEEEYENQERDGTLTGRRK